MDFSLMKDLMDRLTDWVIPGNSISIRLDGKEIFSYQAGYSDIESKEKMTADKLFNMYSCTKPVTVTAALQLFEKGYFLLDDPLYEYIPEFKDMYLEDGSKATDFITIRHLFTMTSGLNYNTEIEALKKAEKLTDGKMDTMTVIKCLAEEPLAFNPGESWNYSLSHDVLAAVVEAISGMKFRDYVKKNIFEPLEMNESYFHNDDVLDRVASQYICKSAIASDIVKMQTENNSAGGTVEKKDKSVSLVFGSEYDSGGAGITSSVSDYSLFASALSRGGVGINGERILSSSTVSLMKENQLTEEQMKTFSWAHLKGYGYGLGVRTLLDKAKAGTTADCEFGWGGAAGASIYVDTENKLSCVYAHHMLNPQESFYQPRVRNVLYACMTK